MSTVMTESYKRVRPQMSEAEGQRPAKLAKPTFDPESVSEKTGGDSNLSVPQPRTPPSTPSSAIKNTPYRRSSSHPVSITTQLSHSSQTRAIKETLSPAAAKEAKDRVTSLKQYERGRVEMAHMLRLEIDGAVYEYSKLCDELFHTEESHVDQIMEKITNSPPLQRNASGKWSIECIDALSPEDTQTHAACAKILDIISVAAFRSTPFRPRHETIVPGSSSYMKGDHLDDTNTSPDVIQATLGHREDKRHWGDVEFFAECKGKCDQLGEALLQIARYARAAFTHQIYRKHIFSIAFCGTAVTFVWITRSGIIHSPPIDLKKDAEAFIRAACGLFALNDSNYGYNTHFYYWPSLADETDTTDRQLRVETGNWRWIIIEILCYRLCLVGRATLVVLLSRVGNPQHRAVLKVIWCPHSRVDESKNLEEFKDCPGVCQCRWSICEGSTAVLDPGCLGPSPVQAEFFEVSDEEKATVYETTHSSGRRAYLLGQVKHKKRRPRPTNEIRVCNMILMDEGVNLWHIKHPVHILRILRDGLVGYAEVVRKGYVHRDISIGNILCQPRNPVELIESFWEDKKPDSDYCDNGTILDDTSDRYNFDDITFLVPEEAIEGEIELKDYIKERYAMQKPLGSLFDFEFMVRECRHSSEVRSIADRTGTIAFMSAQILDATEKQPVVHSFMHDLESFFWVFVWLIFSRAKRENRLDTYNRKQFGMLFVGDATAAWKKIIIIEHGKASGLLKSLVENTSWENIHLVGRNFATFLNNYMYSHSPAGGAGSATLLMTSMEPDELAKAEPQSPEKMRWEEKWRVIKHLIDIFDVAIVKFQES
ncbi:hypothetical protein FRC11_012489 [Ceratobasidium sp. 423]|nr:hypothetical protein FRC11_012489 [Ceratobasidium sp. 423]